MRRWADWLHHKAEADMNYQFNPVILIHLGAALWTSLGLI